MLTHLKKINSNIALLQETKLSDSEHSERQTGLVKFTLPLYSQNKRGVAILINEHLPFILEHEESDPEGRFILRTGSIF